MTAEVREVSNLNIANVLTMLRIAIVPFFGTLRSTILPAALIPARSIGTLS